jgi:hypothetical protein
MDDSSSYKNVFVGGVARSGKSTFSKRMCEMNKYNRFPLDYVISSLKNNFPECNISNSVVIGESSEKIALLLSTIVKIMDSKDEKYIIDSAHVMPSDIVPYLDRDKWDIYFIGYPNISKFTKFSTIRKYDDKTDWTSRRSDEELLSIVEKLISISKKIQEECEELDVPFIDTSSDMIEVLDEFFETELI